MPDADYTLTLDEYQRQALKTLARDLPKDMYRAVLGLGIAGEAGEVADLIKKELGHGHPANREKVGKEIGDVLWYIACIADDYGYTLHEIGKMNIEKLTSRYPNGFEVERSINR